MFRTAGSEQVPEESRPAKATPIVWFSPGRADPNQTEVLFFAFLLVAAAETVSELNHWAQRVVKEKTDAKRLTSAWRA